MFLLREPTQQFLHDPFTMGSNGEKRRGDSFRVHCVYLSIYLDIQYTYLSINLSIDRQIDRSILLFVYLFIYPFIYLSIYPSIHLSIYLSIYLSDHKPVLQLMPHLDALVTCSFVFSFCSAGFLFCWVTTFQSTNYALPTHAASSFKSWRSLCLFVTRGLSIMGFWCLFVITGKRLQTS